MSAALSAYNLFDADIDIEFIISIIYRKFLCDGREYLKEKFCQHQHQPRANRKTDTRQTSRTNIFY